MRLPYINNIIDVQRSYQSLLGRQPYKKSRGAHARLREMARPEKSQMTSGNRSANLEKCQEQMQTQTRMEMWIDQNISDFSSLAI